MTKKWEIPLRPNLECLMSLKTTIVRKQVESKLEEANWEEKKISFLRTEYLDYYDDLFKSK